MEQLKEEYQLPVYLFHEHAGGGALLFAVHDPLYPGTAQYRLFEILRRT